MLQSTRIPRLGAFFLYFSLLSPIAPTKQHTVQREPVLGLPLLSLLLLIGSQSVTEANSTNAAYSTTGTGTWSAATLPSSARWFSVCYGGDKFVAVALDSNKAAYSTTGTGTWSAATLPSSAYWYSVCYGGNKFVAVADSSTKAAYSTTGTGTWSAATLPSSAYWCSVCYGGNKFVAVAYNSDKAAYSSDGINWTGSSCQLSFSQKGKIVITTTGSGTLTFKSGVSGTTEYSVSGTQTTTVEESRLTGSSLTYFLSDGVYTTTAALTYGENKTELVEETTTKTVNVTDTADKLCLRSTSNTAVTWAIANSSGTITKANVTPSSSNNGRYYYDVTNGYTPKYAKRSLGTKTEEVYDMIDFVNTNSPTAKNGVLGTSGLSGTNTDWLYTVGSASGARLTAGKLGAIELIVAPSMTSASGGTLTLLHGSDTAQKTITEKTTIVIPASDMQVSGTAPGATYYIDFNCTNLVFLRAKFVKWQPIFTKPSVPSRSSVIDYSQNVSNKPSYNTNNKTLVFTQQDNATYDTALGYWRLTGGSHCIVDMQKYAKNDFFFFTEEYNPQSKSVAKAIWYGNGNQKTYQSRISAMYLPGMVGMFFKGTEYWPGFGHGGSGNHKMIYGGFTQPINAVLYGYGMGGNGSTNINTDAYVNDACSKLKTTGARVYVVKFRKQDKYNNIVSNNVTRYSNLTGSNTWTDTPTNHSYSEIDTCATSTGGKVYDIGTAADDTASNGTSANATALKETLDDIAADIKNWAGYEEATLAE